MKLQYVLISGAIIGYSTILDLVRRIIFPLLTKISEKRGWDLPARQRFPYSIRDHRNRSVVWIHAASLGEAKLLFKFLEILEQRHPEDLYLLTAATRNGVKYLESRDVKSVCATGFLPLDTIPLVSGLVDHFRVTRVWLLETELWPSMLWTCRRKGIPVGIVNARIEEKSFSNYKRFRGVLKFLFGCFDVVLAQNETYAQRFAELGVKTENIHIVGNLKSHIMIKRPPRKEWLALRKGLNISDNQPVITAACVHAPEGRTLRVCLDILKKNKMHCKLIVVPRHLQDVPDLLKQLGGNALHLRDITTSRKWDICVIEKIGILDEMYKIADAAIVGGTFDSTGGHNVWDPAKFGIPVFFGPDYHTQIDGCEKLITAGVGFKAEESRDLATLILRVMKTEAKKFVNAQLLFQETINKRQAVLEPLIP